MSEQKTFDPFLRKAMAEIVAVMKKYDCAGYVALGSRSHFEFRFHIDASWNVMTMEEAEHGMVSLRLRFKGKAGPEKLEAINATVGFLYNLRDNQFLQLRGLQQFIEGLEQQAIVEHRPGEPKNDDREIEDKI